MANPTRKTNFSYYFILISLHLNSHLFKRNAVLDVKEDWSEWEW
jgi:hypothetical protein